MGAQGGPQAYSQEPIYTPRILRDPGEPPVSRPSQPHVQFDMGGVRLKITWIDRCEDENMEFFRCNIFHPTYLPTLALQANRGELLNGDHRNHLLHLHLGAPIRLDNLATSTSSNFLPSSSQGTPTRSTGGRDALPPPPPPPTNESSHPGHPGMKSPLYKYWTKWYIIRRFCI